MKRRKYLFYMMLLFLFLTIGCSTETKEEPPEAIVKINNDKIETVKGSYTWEIDGFFSDSVIHADALAPYQIADEFNMNAEVVKPNSVVKIEFSDGSNPQISGYLWVDEKKDEELPSQHQQLTLPSEKGEYIIEIQAEWSKGESSYTFIVEVQ
jgi:hypothetical protein